MEKRRGRIFPGGRNLLLFLLAALVIITLTASGCGRGQEEGPPENGGTKQGEEQNSATGDGTGDENEVVTLFFADDQAEKLVAEEREVKKDQLPAAVVEELIKGSETGLGRTIPEGTKLLSIQVKDGVAYVDFSQEFKDNHWGGSAGELGHDFRRAVRRHNAQLMADLQFCQAVKAALQLGQVRFAAH